MSAVDCACCLERLPELVGGSLREAEARALNLHLQGCGACAAALREWRALAAVLILPGSASSAPAAEEALAKAWASPQVSTSRVASPQSSLRWQLGLLVAITSLGLITWGSGAMGRPTATRSAEESPVGAGWQDRAGSEGRRVEDPNIPMSPDTVTRAGGAAVEPVSRPSRARPWDAEPDAGNRFGAATAARGRLLALAGTTRSLGQLPGAAVIDAQPAAASGAAPDLGEPASPPDGGTAGGASGGEESGAAKRPQLGPETETPTPADLPFVQPSTPTATGLPPSTPPSPEPPTVHELEGEVVDEDGRPIPGALLHFWVEPEQADQPLVHLQDADDQGRFRAGLPPGGYRLRGEAPGHGPAWWGGPDRDQATVIQLPLAPGNPVLRLVLRRLSDPADPPSPPPSATASPEPSATPGTPPSAAPVPPLPELPLPPAPAAGSAIGEARAPVPGGLPGQRRAAS